MAIENNMVVAFSYELKDNESGEVLDASRPGMPLEFITGKNNIIPGLEKEIITMSLGESRVVIVAPEEAYGIHNEDAVNTYPKEQFAGIELEVGMPLYGQAEDGSTVQVIVKSFTDNDVTIDHNHPLAGKTLAFAVVLDSIREASVEEVMNGFVHSHCDDHCDDHGSKKSSGGCGSGGCGCSH